VTKARDHKDRPARPGGFDALRTERWVALVRFTVIAVVVGIHMLSGEILTSSGPVVIALLVLALTHATWSLVASRRASEPSFTSRTLSLLIDVYLVTTWVVMSDGAMSDYWALYLIVVVSAAMRFDLGQTMVIAIGMVALYGGLVIVDDRLPPELVLHRTSLMVITGFAVGILSQQRLVHRRVGQALEAEVVVRSRELDEERAEVERLKRVDVAKSEFVAVAAHEFRTPLAAVIGVLSTLKEHGSVLTPEDRLELIDGATSQANRLARLVDDLLTVARIEDGILRLTLEPVEPRHLLAEAAQVSGMTGRLVIQIGRLGHVRCDQDAIIRVLTNLLDNARKYSPADSKVHISVTLEGDMMRFTVSDEGSGIPEEERTEIFERFRRLEGGKTKPGAGLGLYICRGLVEAHGGTIRADNGPHGGAEMSFTLPRAVKGAGEEPVPSGTPAEDGSAGSDGVVRPIGVAVPVEDLPPAAVR
jgi:signal transduction histidine kinase